MTKPTMTLGLYLAMELRAKPLMNQTLPKTEQGTTAANLMALTQSTRLIMKLLQKVQRNLVTLVSDIQALQS